VKPAILLAAAAGLLCAASAQRDPDAPRAGEWEITTTPVSVTGPDISVDVSTTPNVTPEITRQCYDGHVPRLGEQRGRCTITRVGTRGAITDVETSCADGDGKQPIVSTVTGTRSPDRYDYRSTLTYDDGRRVLVRRAQGRRLGDCPAKP
jgi:hypothetical protein